MSTLSDLSSVSPIPITLVTGFLGSGKTTLLLNLLPQLPPTSDYRLALVKNEIGDTAVDSRLASQSGIEVTKELEGGCICCNLTGQLGDALESLAARQVDRIVIETSGSAFPATLALEINRIASASPGRFTLDGVVTVIDVMNWKGYEDTSYTARLQARYTDLIVLNKWEDAGEEKLDTVLDRLGDLEVDVAKVKSRRGWVAEDVLLGLDSRMAKMTAPGQAIDGLKSQETHSQIHEGVGHDSEVEFLTVTLKCQERDAVLDMNPFSNLLTSAPKDEVYRIKGIIRSLDSPQSSEGQSVNINTRPGEIQNYILNWAFGRWTFTAISGAKGSMGDGGLELEQKDDVNILRMTMIFARFESAKWEKRLKTGGFVGPADKSSSFDLCVGTPG